MHRQKGVGIVGRLPPARLQGSACREVLHAEDFRAGFGCQQPSPEGMPQCSGPVRLEWHENI